MEQLSPAARCSRRYFEREQPGVSAHGAPLLKGGRHHILRRGVWFVSRSHAERGNEDPRLVLHGILDTGSLGQKSFINEGA